MSGETAAPGECTHPNEAIDPRRYDGNHTVCHQCRSHILVGIAHYANGIPPERQYDDLVARMNRESMRDPNARISLPSGVVGICPNCQQWQRPRTDGTADCFNECRKRGLASKPLCRRPECDFPEDHEGECSPRLGTR